MFQLVSAPILAYGLAANQNDHLTAAQFSLMPERFTPLEGRELELVAGGMIDKAMLKMRLWSGIS